MKTKKYLVVDAAVLPEVFTRVLKAKELLASGDAKTVSRATEMAKVSRSAFYKYQNCVFQSDSGQQVVTIHTVLKDETGALGALLTEISSAGAGVVTINQSTPEDGAAQVSVLVRTEGMHKAMDDLVLELKNQRTVVEVRISK